MSQFKELVSIEYPGIVKNLDRMMETIGGTEKLNETFKKQGSRLELSPRPDIFSHPMLGDKVPTNNLLVKCIEKTITDDQGNVKKIYETKIIGFISFSYKFKALADFQYLPMERINFDSNKPRYKSRYNDIIPESPFSSLSSFNPDAPLLVLPTILSRFDVPTEYYYKDEPVHKNDALNKTAVEHQAKSIIGLTRKPRSILAMLVNWDEEIPTEPNAVLLEKLRLHASNINVLEDLKKLFQQRPIWSRNALLYKLKCTRDDLKYLLPCVAFYYPNGPFRCQWIRYGFDPRKNKFCKIYQTLDYRVKQAYIKKDSSDKIMPKRSIYDYAMPLLRREPFKKAQDCEGSVIQPAIFLPPPGTSTETPTKSGIEDEQILLASYTFRPGVLPSCRQCHYQLCEIHVPEVQKLVHENDGCEPDICHDKDGWCKEGTVDKIRAILSTMTDEMLRESEPDEEILDNYDNDDYSDRGLSDEDEYLSYTS
ncbi:general transcription factor 3C polypeptide 5-like [Panonychus citri]|uniref:general transcription factor 3C polypeptide 5-like n=1 Tax=Panonychus citri TaxID=50023 RepID=UPI002307CC2D|nr:general transcription factor 3C polypeptide 5-like [Panonychus citri]